METIVESLQGRLLVATPRLPDENFFRTVVLMVQHNEHGALGVVLNRSSGRSVQELWEDLGDSPCEAQQPVHLGGPVTGPVMAVHTAEDLADLEIFPGVYLAAQKANLDKLVCQQEHRFRVYLGHAGWGGGQLEGELEQGAWLTASATGDYVFYDGDDLWEKVAKHIGADLLISTLKLKEVPDDPSVN